VQIEIRAAGIRAVFASVKCITQYFVPAVGNQLNGVTHSVIRMRRRVHVPVCSVMSRRGLDRDVFGVIHDEMENGRLSAFEVRQSRLIQRHNIREYANLRVASRPILFLSFLKCPMGGSLTRTVSIVLKFPGE
jgi:hypothetical protein